MKRGFRILYYVTVVISTLVGLWHFFVPWMFQWYDYLPTEYENLIVGIDYTNYCFSLLLFGLSLMLIILGRKVLALNKEVVYFYFSLQLCGYSEHVFAALLNHGRCSRFRQQL